MVMTTKIQPEKIHNALNFEFESERWFNNILVLLMKINYKWYYVTQWNKYQLLSSFT